MPAISSEVHARFAHLRGLGNRGYEASAALARAFDASEPSPPVEDPSTRVHVYVADGYNDAAVPASLLPNFVAALASDPTVVGFAVGDLEVSRRAAF